MAGALWFVAIVFAVVFWGAILLQGALLLLQLAIWAAVWATRITVGALAIVYMAVWWLIDRSAAERAWRQAPQPAAGWARGL